jgi:hypothetical protein
VRLDPECKRGDEWPNLSELDVAKRPQRKWRTVAAIFLTWMVVIALIGALFLLLAVLVAEARAHGHSSNARCSFGVLTGEKCIELTVAGSRCLPQAQRPLPPK